MHLDLTARMEKIRPFLQQKVPFAMRIGLLSDTHSHIDDGILAHCKGCDEIWHAGDIGSLEVTDRLATVAPIVAVYGNLDDHQIRRTWPENQLFEREGVRILITHIAGYPGRYNARVKKLIAEFQPQVVMVGHSHIVKVLRDPTDHHLHINPGAAGIHGFHKVRTIATMQIEAGRLHDFKLIELGKRGAIPPGM